MNTEDTQPAAPAEEQPPAVEDREGPASEAPASAEEAPSADETPAEEAPAAAEEEKPAESAKDEKPFRLRSGPTYEEQRAKIVERVEACEASVAKHRNAMKKASRNVAELAAHDLDTQNAVAEYRKEDAAWQDAVDNLNSTLDELRSCDANPEQFGSPAAEEPAAPEEPALWDGSSVEFLDVPEEEYHEAARKREFVSSHYLALYRKCPALYHQEMLGLAPRKDSAAFMFGRAVHVAILQGKDAFDAQFRVDDGPINERTGKPFAAGTKAWDEYFADETRTVISTADFGVIQDMRLSVLEHPVAAALLEKGRAEGTIRVPDLCGLPCQIRIDWFNPERGIVDLKSTADLDRFVWDARDYDYIYQMAFYRQTLAAKFPQAAGAPVNIIAVEKQRPFRCGVWTVNPYDLSLAAGKNAATIGQLAVSLRNGGRWPTLYETIRTLTLKD